MTIDRQAQFSAETRILTDLAFYANPVTISTLQAKTGTYSYKLALGIGPFGKGFASALAALRMGLWLYLASASTSDTTFLYHAGNALGSAIGDSRITIKIDAGAGNLVVQRPLNNSTIETLATAPLPSQFGTTGTWFHIGITHLIHASAGFLSVYINGVRVLNYVGDTRPARWNGSAQAFDSTALYALGPGAAGTSGAQGFSNAHVDDMFIDSMVGEADAPVPSRRFMPSLPTGTGANAAWTGVGSGTNWQNVDDNPNNGDTDYNKALAADLRDTFAYADITLPVDHRIVAVVPTFFARRLDSEIQHKLSVHAYDGLTYKDSSDLDLSMSYDVPVFERLTTQPDNTDWNEADFNTMQFGYRSRGTF